MLTAAAAAAAAAAAVGSRIFFYSRWLVQELERSVLTEERLHAF
jgi:hypothetical protein